MSTLKILVEITLEDFKQGAINEQEAQAIKEKIEKIGLGDPGLANALYGMGCWSRTEVTEVKIKQQFKLKNHD